MELKVFYLARNFLWQGDHFLLLLFQTEQLQISGHLTKVGQFTFNPLSANPTKWSNTLKQFFGFCQ